MSGLTAESEALLEATTRWANGRTRAAYPEGEAPLAVPHWSDVDAFGRNVLEPALAAIEQAAAQRALEGVVDAVAEAIHGVGVLCHRDDWETHPEHVRERVRSEARQTLGLAPSDAAPGEGGRGPCGCDGALVCWRHR